MRHLPAVTLFLLAFATAGDVEAAERPVVVELFTSQGCSSCPPANAELIRLAKQPGVLALSFSVTYWDRLGWKDVFGHQEFTDRQAAYEPRLGERSMFTPQIVVNGRLSAVGSQSDAVAGRIAEARSDRGPAVDLSASQVAIGAGEAPDGGADVLLVRYDPRVQTVAVKRGENADRALPHVNVVRSLERLGVWRGAAVRLDLPRAEPGLRDAVLVQTSNGGPILGAAAR